MDHKIHVANRSNGDIHVWVTPRIDYQLASLGIDLARLAKNFAAIGTVSEAYAMLQATSNAQRFIKDLMEYESMLLSRMIVVKRGEYANVSEQAYRLMQDFYKPAFWQELRGKDTVNLLIRDNAARRSVAFGSNGDHSWIVDERGVRRSEHGTIWQAGGDFRRWHFGSFYIGHTASAAPSLAVINDRLHCFFRHDGGNAILHLVLDGVRWEKAEPWGPGIDNTSDGPCVVPFRNGALLFFRIGPVLKVAEGNGFTFRTPGTPVGIAISGRPTAACLGDLVCVAGRADDPALGMMTGMSVAKPIVFATTRGGGFAVGSTSFQTRFSPSLAAYRGAFHLFFTAEDGRVMHSTSKNGAEWTRAEATGRSSSGGSTVIESNGAFVMLYRDPDGNGIFYARSDDGFHFGPKDFRAARDEAPYFGYDLRDAPAAAIYDNQVHLMGQDAEGTGMMWSMPRLDS